MMNINKELEFVDLTTNKNKNKNKNKKFMIIGIPERIIANNVISYKLPIRFIDEKDNIENETKYINISEEDMINMLNNAKESFKKDDIDKAYV